MVRKPKSAETRPAELSRGPFCAVLRAEREDGNENLLGAPWVLAFMRLIAPGAEVVLITPAM
eukprot:6687237-Alexandrium_andersonii.AAC.1